MAIRDIAELKSLRGEELDKIFVEGSLPSHSEIQGFWRGLALPQTSKTPVPSFLEKVFILTGDILWKGKVFVKIDSELRGVNILTRAKIPAFHFKVVEDRSRFDGNPCLVLKYSVFPNPFLVRTIRDEIRKVGDGVILGLMFFSFFDRLFIPSIYFALQKEL